MDAEARRERFEAVAPALVDPLRRYLARRTDAATADDVLSETLLVCWRRLEDVPDDPLPWAYAVARRALANAERGARRQRRVAARVAAVDPPRVVAEGPGAGPIPDAPLDRALAALAAADAELLRLWAWEDLGPSEIATVLGTTPNAAGIRLHRARGRLREELRKIEAAAGHEESWEGGAR